MEYYNASFEEIMKELGSTINGLNSTEVKKRIEKYGKNELATKSEINPLKIFIDQFKSFIIYILLFAVVFSLLAGEIVDSIIIIVILLANAIIGFIQELGAQKNLEALKQMTSIKANVKRNNKFIKIESSELVPGDIIFLEAGDKIPADARIIESSRLKIEESALTGESVPVDKNSDIIKKNVQIGDQANMLFSSTTVVGGTVTAIVTSTGMQTEIGKIADLIKSAEEEVTPLQRRLDSFGKKLGWAIIGVCIIVFAMSFGKEVLTVGISYDSFTHFSLIAISLAVAAVPTALPAVVTIALSLGVKKLLKKKALVRRLSSVETLGSCDVICTDKTGTLTQNEMTVRKAWTFDGEANLEGNGYIPIGKVSTNLNPLLYKIGLACNNASLYSEQKRWKITGDPTEAALLVSAKKQKIAPNTKRLSELPFDSDRKLMSVLIKEGTKTVMYTKGATDQILKRCSHAIVADKKVKLTSKHISQIKSQNDNYSTQALRVLSFAIKENTNTNNFTEKGLTFVGLQAMIDPPRPDVVDAIKRTKEAGIRTIMITGDYKETAKAIAKEIGIEGEAITGEELEKMSEKMLIKRLKQNANIFARVIPEHKQKIISALQKMKHTVAMTGDGVNDAPALKKANIGIAVGSGTEVAKEASDFVLLDDSFAHIVNAVEEGRGIYENIQKSIMLLLSGNLGEVLIIFLAILFGFNLPLTAILLLWINLVTDGAPAIAYSLDPYGKKIMEKKPRPYDEAILPLSKLMLLIFLGAVGTAIALFMFYKTGGNSGDAMLVKTAQTLVFNFVVLYELILTYAIRRDYDVKTFSNAWLWGSIVFSVILQAVLMYTPMNEVFKIVPLGFEHLKYLLFAGIVFYGASTLYHLIAKFILKIRNHH